MTNGTRRGWGVSVTPRPLFTPGKDPVPNVQEAALDKCGKTRPPAGFDPRTFQHVVSRYTDYTTRPTVLGYGRANYHSPAFIHPQSIRQNASSSRQTEVNGKMIIVHAIKAYRGSRGTAPLIFNLVITWRISSYFTICRFIIKKEPRYSFNRRLRGPQSRYERFGQNKIYCACRDSNPGPSSP